MAEKNLPSNWWGYRRLIIITVVIGLIIKFSKVLITAVKKVYHFIRSRVRKSVDALPAGQSPMKKREIKNIIKMGDNQDPNLIAPLLQSLRSKQKGVPELAYQALLKIKLRAADEPLLEALDDWDAKIVDVAIEVLGGIADVKALPRLAKLADKPVKKDMNYYPHLESTLEKIRQNMPPIHEDYICGTCFVRFGPHHVKCKTYGDFRYSACKNCRSDAYRLTPAETVVLYLDYVLKEPYTRENDTLYVNWLKLKRPFDFDEIRVNDSRETDLEEMVMILRNDMNDKRRGSLQSKKLFIAEDLELSPAKRNLLQDNFQVM